MKSIPSAKFIVSLAILFAPAFILLVEHSYGSLRGEDAWLGQEHPVQVHAMDVVLQLHRERRVTVTERLQVEMLDGRSHGIYRLLPLAAQPPARKAEAPLLRVLEASIDGVPCRTDDLKAIFGTQNVAVFLRDRSRTLSPGMHAFTLVYEMTGTAGFGFGRDDDWIDWNVTGSGWGNGVLASSCTVVPAEGAPLSRQVAFHGDRDSPAPPVELGEAKLADGRTCFVYRARGPVNKYQHFTVHASFPKGTVPEPALYRPGEDADFTWQCAGACAFSLALCLVLWLCWGRDPKPGPIVPLCAPPRLPKDLAGRLGLEADRPLSPAQLHYLAGDCTLESPGLAAVFLSLAAKGRCRLAGKSGEGYSVERLEPEAGAAQEALSREEEAVLNALPEGKVMLNEVDPRLLNSLKAECRWTLGQDFGGLFRTARLLRFAGFAVPLFLLAFIQLSHTQLLRCFGPAWPDYPWNAVKLIIALLVSGTVLSLMLPRQNVVGRGWKWLGRIALLLCGAFFMALLFLPKPVVDDVLSSPLKCILPDATALQAALFFGTMLWPVLVGPLMQSKTRELARLQEQIAGFALYLKAAEAPGLSALNPPSEDLALYARLLPYACALELEKAWAGRFERQLADLGNRAAGQAGWIGGLLGAGFSPSGFARAVSS